MVMDVKQAILMRHSVRAFKDHALAPGEILELLEAARLAPSSLNSQPWRFKVVTDPETKEWFGSKEASKGQTWLAKAPALFVCCADLKGYIRDSQASAFFFRENKLLEDAPMDGIDAYVAKAEADPEMARFGASAMNVGISVAFLMLRAVQMGLGTCWVGMFNEQQVKSRLAIPDDLRVVCLLAVGHPAESQENITHTRKALDDIVLG